MLASPDPSRVDWAQLKVRSIFLPVEVAGAALEGGVFMAMQMSSQLDAFLLEGAGMEMEAQLFGDTLWWLPKMLQPGWSSTILLFLGWGQAGSR